MKTAKARKNLTKVLVIALALTLLVGTFAFFTDQKSLEGSAKVGNLSITATGDITTALLAGGDADILNAGTINNWNPGDEASFSYTIASTGNKAVRYQETIKLTVTGVEETALANCMLQIDGTNVTPTLVSEVGSNKYELTYVVAEGVLSGVDTGAADVEVVTGKEATTVTPAYTLKFSEDALNEYQNAEIAIKVDVVAVQYANTDSIADYTPEA